MNTDNTIWCWRLEAGGGAGGVAGAAAAGALRQSCAGSLCARDVLRLQRHDYAMGPAHLLHHDADDRRRRQAGRHHRRPGARRRRDPLRERQSPHHPPQAHALARQATRQQD